MDAVLKQMNALCYWGLISVFKTDTEIIIPRAKLFIYKCKVVKYYQL